jgi:hypothetical protein
MTKGYTKISDEDRAALSPLRQKAVKILEDKVPARGLTSDEPAFNELTGYTTASLRAIWDANPKSILTTCNAFSGRYAILLGAPAGCWLTRGILQLDLVKQEVPDSWFDWHSGKAPQPGDIYAKPYTDPKTKQVQVFGHVGVLYGWHDTIFYDTVDSGQGGRGLGIDLMKWSIDHLYRPFDFTGWVDIDIYMAGVAKLPKKR